METFTSVALFGEAEKGEYHKGYFCESLSDLMDVFGNPPDDSLGLFYATQSLLFHHPLVYFRVEEEGFSYEDYLSGLHILESSPLNSKISALCIPGVGDKALLDIVIPFCTVHKQVLITNESDLFDYLMINPR